MARGKGRRLFSFPVLAVVALMAFVHYSTVCVFVEGWFGLGSSAGTYNALVFSFLALMCLASFCTAVLVDPGRVPAFFAPDTEESRGNGNMKYCDKCSSYKPPRSHHCRVCRSCVLKMDHHCLWINNCVGYANYKPFIIFVLYASVSSIYSLVIFVGSYIQNDLKFVGNASIKCFYVSYGILITILSIVLTTLLGWHIYLLSHNMTTIEYREGIRAMWLARKSGQRYRHLFDLGILKNLREILGPNVVKWLCPLALGHLKDGMQFQSCRD